MIKKGQANRQYTWQTWGSQMVRKCIDGCEAGTGWQSTYIEKLGSAGVTHQMCLVLWTWRKLANETNAKNAHKICWKIVLTWGIQTALAIHITQSQDYPYAKNEYKLIVAIYRTRMTILMQEMNAIADSHLLHKNHQEAERIWWIMIFLVWERSAGFCSPTPIPEQPKKQKKQLRNEGEREESFLVPKCQI